MRRLAVVALAALLLCASAPARGSESLSLYQASRAQDSGDNLVAASFHSNAWLSMEAHYLRRVSVLGRRLLVGTSLDLPLLLWIRTGDLDTVRISLRGAAELVRVRWFAVEVDLQTRLGVQDSALNRSVGWDFQLTVAPSLAFSSWSLATFVGLRQGLATHIKHGDIVHDAFEDRYPAGVSGITGPRDGWIAGGNTRIPFGLSFGVDLPRDFAIHGAAGLVWTYSALGVGMFDAMMLGRWPFFVDLGASWRF